MPKSADRGCTGLTLDLRHATPRSTLEQQDLHRLHLDSQARRRRLVAHARVDEPGTALAVSAEGSRKHCGAAVAFTTAAAAAA